MRPSATTTSSLASCVKPFHSCPAQLDVWMRGGMHASHEDCVVGGAAASDAWRAPPHLHAIPALLKHLASLQPSNCSSMLDPAAHRVGR